MIRHINPRYADDRQLDKTADAATLSAYYFDDARHVDLFGRPPVAPSGTKAESTEAAVTFTVGKVTDAGVPQRVSGRGRCSLRRRPIRWPRSNGIWPRSAI